MKYQDLDQSGKDYALQQHAEHLDYEWWDCTYEDFVQVCKCMGFEVTENLHKGGTQQTAGNSYQINFSGFCSQGDGASFGATFSLRDGLEASTRIRDYAGTDETLHHIADEVQAACTHAMGVSHMLTFDGVLRTGIKLGNSNYAHSNTMQISSECAEFLNLPDDMDGETEVIRTCVQFDEAVLKAARSLADWLYKTLEAEYNYLTSEQSLREAAEANEWEFDEAGCITFDKERLAA